MSQFAYRPPQQPNSPQPSEPASVWLTVLMCVQIPMLALPILTPAVHWMQDKGGWLTTIYLFSVTPISFLVQCVILVLTVIRVGRVHRFQLGRRTGWPLLGYLASMVVVALSVSDVGDSSDSESPSILEQLGVNADLSGGIALVAFVLAVGTAIWWLTMAIADLNEASGRGPGSAFKFGPPTQTFRGPEPRQFRGPESWGK
ncbi:hypothetical protein [Propionimicrobium sp. PCR01-08-3]|uniref:hypothetical protein n=1 Tax=Propionimicrobium sp. PCR01-08-3 TaxID=3052086 RepID=UPI00255CC61F|nr:hypothetical protein [Propionimicrobium sp. PCR01-08-3]WIY83926.1 hypothetical protein QQ658_06175 [Propionimicrobium sp. PCR01-08-3]